MASTISLLSEKHFLCSLCKDIFSSPVTTPCGHSFCKACLCHHWTRHRSDHCPSCKRLFAARPDLSVNRILAEVSENYKRTRPKTPPVEDMVVDIKQMIQERLLKIERLKHSLQLLKNSCLREVRESHAVFSAFVSSMEQSHKAVVASIEERQREEETRVEIFVKELEHEIKELRNEHSESESWSTEPSGDKEFDELSFAPTVTLSNMKDWAKVSVETDPCVGVTRKALSDLMEKIKAEVNRLSKSELKRIQKYPAEVTLSQKTAHPYLYVSDDRKQVRHTDKLQEVPDNPKRFDRVANVLGRESFSNGRFYWEVEVGEKIEWNLGVVRQTVNRKGRFTVCPANGFWTLSLKTGGQYIANTATITPVTVEQRPKKVGVFLDYTEGRLSFYCVETAVHIYTFTDTFTDRLHPVFCPGRLHGGKNSAPLIITTICCDI
ncbi:bloodthirsty-related gene family, member 2 [Aplochiton taeniatus]